MSLNPHAVRAAMLAAQGLLTPPEKPAAKDDLLAAIRRMGYLQIDTIQAVHRSQHLVLWSRLGDYPVDWLDQLHAEGELFEYYAHALCYLPIEHYPVFRGKILYDDRTGNGWHKWAAENPEVVKRVREAIKARGPVCSADFESETFSTGWGDVKAEKLALSRMFHTGEVMVAYRDKFRRFYDLRERVLPAWDDADAPRYEAVREALFLETIRALGAVREDWVAAYYYLLKTGMPEVLADLVLEGKLHRMVVPEWDLPVYVHPDNRALVDAAVDGGLTPTHTTLLSPFDPLVSDRSRALDLFDFEYRMESYTPAKDRRWGYFCLPILHRGRLVGRLDPKAHRREKRLEIKKIYLEPGVEIGDDLVQPLRRTLAAFTAWHGLESWEVTAADPPELKKALA